MVPTASATLAHQRLVLSGSCSSARFMPASTSFGMSSRAAVCSVFQSRSRSQWPGTGRRSLQTRCSAEAARLIAEGKERYNAGNRMGALDLFERSLQKNPTTDQKQQALYGATCVHASFGDVELAQVTLRDAIYNGLDFAVAMQNPDYVDFQASQQVIIKLRKFAEAANRIKSVLSKEAEQATSPARSKPRFPVIEADVSNMFKTEIKDMDTSILGIVRRVLTVVVVGLVLGTILFYVGFELTFGSEYK